MNSALFSSVLAFLATLYQVKTEVHKYLFNVDPENTEFYCKEMDPCVPLDLKICAVDKKQRIVAEFKNQCVLFGVNCLKKQGLFVQKDYETCIKKATRYFDDRMPYYGVITDFYRTYPLVPQKEKKYLDPQQEKMLESLIKLVI